MILFTLKHPSATQVMLGYLPNFLSEEDPADAQVQLNRAYAHGGGYDPFPGFQLLENGNLQYPNDPPTRLIAEARLHDKETIRIYEHAWVMILQDDGSWVVSRMD
jgi:hypothetical protein